MKNFCEDLFFFFFFGDRLKNFCEDIFFFFGEHLRFVSLVLGLGFEHSCPWPRECLSSERLSLASHFFCVLGLGLEPCVLDSTSAYDKRLNILVHGVKEDSDNAWQKRDRTIEKFEQFLQNGLNKLAIQMMWNMLIFTGCRNILSRGTAKQFIGQLLLNSSP